MDDLLKDKQIKGRLAEINEAFNNYYNSIYVKPNTKRITMNSLFNYLYLTKLHNNYMKDEILEKALTKDIILKNMNMVIETINEQYEDNSDGVELLVEGSKEFDFNFIFEDKDLYNFYKDKPVNYLIHMSIEGFNITKDDITKYKDNDFKIIKNLYKNFSKVNMSKDYYIYFTEAYSEEYAFDILFSLLELNYLGSFDESSFYYESTNLFFYEFLYNYENLSNYLKVFPEYKNIFEVSMFIQKAIYLLESRENYFDKIIDMKAFLEGYDHEQPLEWNMELLLLKQ